jgi:hypothetical protein
MQLTAPSSSFDPHDGHTEACFGTSFFVDEGGGGGGGGGVDRAAGTGGGGGFAGAVAGATNGF